MPKFTSTEKIKLFKDESDNIGPQPLNLIYLSKCQKNQGLNNFFRTNYISAVPFKVEIGDLSLLYYHNYNLELIICFTITPLKYTDQTIEFYELTMHPKLNYKNKKNNNNIKFPKINLQIYQIFCTFKFQLYSLIKSAIDYPKIHFCGYGDGGVLAAIASLFVSIYFPQFKVTCTTFGSPVCGNQSFVELYNKTISQSYRIVSADDAYPDLNINKKFKHINTEILFSGNSLIELIHLPTKINKFPISLVRYLHFFSQIKDEIKVNIDHLDS